MGEDTEDHKDRRDERIDRRHSTDRRDSERIVKDEPRRQRDDRRDEPDT